MIRKLICILLTAAMCLTLAAGALAAGAEPPISPAPDGSVPEKNGTLSVKIAGDGILQVHEGSVWNGVAPGAGSIEAVPGTSLEFQASSETAASVEVMLDGAAVEVTPEETADNLPSWSFSIEMPAVDAILSVSFSSEPLPDKNGTLSVEIAGDGILQVHEGSVWNGVAPGAGSIEAEPGTVLEFQAVSETAASVEVTLDGAAVAVTPEETADDDLPTWSFSIEIPAADAVLRVVFSGGTADRPVDVSIAGDGVLRIKEGDVWHGVAGGVSSFTAEPGAELEFQAVSPTAKTVFARLGAENLAVTAEPIEDGMRSWTFSFTMPEGGASLSVVFVDPDAEDIRVAVDVTGDGTLHMLEGDAWHGVAPDPESMSVAPGDEVVFRASSETAAAVGILFNGEAVAWQAEADAPGTWQFSVVFPEYDSELSVVFGDAEPDSALVRISAAGAVAMQVDGEEWIEAAGNNYFLTPDTWVTVRAGFGEQEAAPRQYLDNNHAAGPESYGQDYAEFTFCVGRWGNDVRVQYTDDPLITADYAADSGAGLYLTAEDGSTIYIAPGGRFPSSPEAERECTLLIDAEKETRIVRVTFGGNELPFTAEDSDEFIACSFMLPAGSGGRLALETTTASGSQITVAPDSPTSVDIVPNIDGSGMVLRGVEAERQGRTTPVSEISHWLELPEGFTLQVLTQDGQAAEGDAPVATGMTVLAAPADGTEGAEQLLLAVPGDVTGTGILSIAQLTRMARAINGTEALTGVYLMAGDLNGTGRIDVGDLTLEAKRLTISE